MSIEWYYANGDSQIGPISADEVGRRFAEDGFPPSAQVWREGFENWQRAQDVPELKGRSSPPPRPRLASPSEATTTKWGLWRSIFTATLIGFAFSLGLAALSALGKGAIRPIDPYWILNPEIIGEWIGSIGVIPLICAIGTLVIRFREARWWMFPLTLFAVVIGIGIAISALVVAVAAVYPVPDFPFAAAGPERDTFVKSAVASCVRAQRNSSENRDVPNETIDKFCKCYADSMANFIKKEYVGYYAKNNTFPPEAMPQVTAEANRCIQGARN